MAKYLTYLGIFMLLALDWAALDDVTTGNELDYTSEYLVLIVSTIIFAVMIGRRFIKK